MEFPWDENFDFGDIDYVGLQFYWLKAKTGDKILSQDIKKYITKNLVTLSTKRPLCYYVYYMNLFFYQTYFLKYLKKQSAAPSYFVSQIANKNQAKKQK